jgi:hypothetical protein
MPDKEEKTDEEVQREAYVAALQRERAGYVQRGLDDRVAAVDAELKRLGVSRPEAHKGTERAVTPPAEKRPTGRGKATS